MSSSEFPIPPAHLAQIQALSAQTLAAFRTLEKLADRLTRDISAAWRAQPNVLAALINSKVLSEILSELRRLHNQVLTCDFFKEIIPPQTFKAQLKEFLLNEKVNLNLNLSRFLESTPSSEEKDPSRYGEGTLSDNLLDKKADETSAQNNRSTHFQLTNHPQERTPPNRTPERSPFQSSFPFSYTDSSETPRNGSREPNKFSTISYLFRVGMIDQSKKSLLKNLVVQENQEVLRAFKEFQTHKNSNLLVQKLSPYLKD